MERVQNFQCRNIQLDLRRRENDFSLEIKVEWAFDDERLGEVSFGMYSPCRKLRSNRFEHLLESEGASSGGGERVGACNARDSLQKSLPPILRLNKRGELNSASVIRVRLPRRFLVEGKAGGRRRGQEREGQKLGKGKSGEERTERRSELEDR